MPKIYQLLTDEIEEFVLQYINEHQLKPHDKLPTERELSTSLNVNRITLRNGLQKLIDKGMIYSHRGKGYFVCPQKINRTLCYFSFPEADSLLKDHSYKAEAQNFLPTIMSNIIHNFLFTYFLSSLIISSLVLMISSFESNNLSKPSTRCFRASISAFSVPYTLIL